MTQNVDGLHRQAWLASHEQNSDTQAIDSLLELHGNINANKCIDCGSPFEVGTDIDPKQIPACSQCGGKIRPDVVWFGEMLDPEVIDRAFIESEQADVFLVIGTSALVHPAASLPVSAKRNGAAVIEINLEETPLTEFSDVSLRGKSGEILPGLVKRLQN
jgi:NAD-dependent deacetylase